MDLLLIQITVQERIAVSNCDATCICMMTTHSIDIQYDPNTLPKPPRRHHNKGYNDAITKQIKDEGNSGMGLGGQRHDE